MPAAGAASPGTEGFPEQEREPYEAPEAATEQAEQQMQPVANSRVDEDGLPPAMRTVRRESDALRSGASFFSQFFQGAGCLQRPVEASMRQQAH